jgi:membrane protein
MAGGVAFFGFLSVFPALFALLSVYGLWADPRDVERQMRALGGLLPRQVRDAMTSELMAVVSRSPGTLGVELVASFLTASWAATKGTHALMIAVAVVRDERESRSQIQVTVIALLLTIAGVVSGAVAFAALLAFPSLLVRVGLSRFGADLVGWLRWPLLAALLLLGLAILYRYGPPRVPPGRRWITPGTLVATGLWLCGSSLFSWFVPTHTSYAGLDGSIAAITVLLTWFLISAYIFILGAAIDAESGVGRQAGAQNARTPVSDTAR